jgi:integrase
LIINICKYRWTSTLLLVLLLGMASLRKRSGSNKWVCCFTRPDGTRAQASTGQTDKAAAMANCLAWEAAAQQARTGAFTEAQARKVVSDIAERSGMGPLEFASVTQFFTNWIRSKELTKAKGTTVRYKHTADSFVKFFGKRASANLANVRPADIAAFRDQQIAEGKSQGTANMVVKTLRIAFNVARRQGLILLNPAEAVDLFDVGQQSRDTFTRQQIADLLRVADTEWRGMILVGACHGLRLGDAARLTWENINSERQALIFYPQKTARGANRKPEEYPMHPDFSEYVAALPIRTRNPNEPLFPKLSKRKLTGRTGLSETFRQLMHKAGIFAAGESTERKKGKGRRVFELSFHSLRHTAISELANRGVAKEIRMKLSGHKSAVHERYTHHELEALRVQIERVPSFLPPKKT